MDRPDNTGRNPWIATPYYCTIVLTGYPSCLPGCRSIPWPSFSHQKPAGIEFYTGWWWCLWVCLTFSEHVSDSVFPNLYMAPSAHSRKRKNLCFKRKPIPFLPNRPFLKIFFPLPVRSFRNICTAYLLRHIFLHQFSRHLSPFPIRGSPTVNPVKTNRCTIVRKPITVASKFA